MVRMMDHPTRLPVWPAGDSSPALYRGDRVHLVGIGGAGMSGLARVLAGKGLEVSGSDRTASKTTSALEALGIPVAIGHGAAALPAGTKLVVHTPAVGADNPELIAAARRGIPVAKRFDLLAPLIDAADTIAVAGTHGKTTTSGLIAWVLAVAGQDPGFFVGGEVANLGANAAAGAGRFLVIEADEYDRSFLHGHPQVAVITNVEHDHPDLYPTLGDITAAFEAFARRVRPGGRLVACAESEEALNVAARAGDGAEAIALDLYYVKDGPELHGSARADLWWAEQVDLRPDGTSFEAWHQVAGADHADPIGRFDLRLAGRHNVANAMAAIIVAERLGLPREAARQALATYRGTERRYQVLGTWSGVTVIDDYAHHPTEIAATLAATRARYPGSELWAVIEPHTYSRLAALEAGFTAAARAADRVYFAPIYAAREAIVPGLTSARLASAVPGAKSSEDLEQLVDLIAADLMPMTAIAAVDTGALDASGSPDAAAAPDAAVGTDVLGPTSGRRSRPAVLLFLGAGDIIQASAAFMARLEEGATGELIRQARARGLDGEVRRRQPLAAFTSLKVGGPAAIAVTVKTVGDLGGWWLLADELGLPCRVLGRGSNVLSSDQGFPGLIILNRCEAWQGTDAGDPDAALVVAESGVTLASLTQALAREGWCGFEAGVGIPGSVGAGTITNAGAHGWDMAASILWAEVLDLRGATLRLGPDDLAFRYRQSALKGDTSRLVLRVALKVRRDEPALILGRLREYQERRRASQPNAPSVGSMFKNPPGDFAGRLIEAAGLKGTRRGGAEISTKHANFFVNHGEARAADVAELITLARAAVAKTQGVSLHLEIEPLGEIPQLPPEVCRAD